MTERTPTPPTPPPKGDDGSAPKKSDEQVDREAEHQAEVNRRFQEQIKMLRDQGIL